MCHAAHCMFHAIPLFISGLRTLHKHDTVATMPDATDVRKCQDGLSLCRCGTPAAMPAVLLDGFHSH